MTRNTTNEIRQTHNMKSDTPNIQKTQIIMQIPMHSVSDKEH